MTHYLSSSDYFKSLFGGKVYKLSLDGGMTCPNRDGTVGTGGCIFCSRGGSGDFAQARCESVWEQIDRAKAQVKGKYQGNRFIAYFQNFTNTYASLPYLEKLFSAALSHPDVVGLSIGTRPDCLGEDVLDLLEELNTKKPLMVELGLQTSKEETARLINRGYALSTYDTAVAALAKRGIHVVTHVIFGLPGETREDMLATVSHVAKVGSHGIKIQLLHVLRDTPLETLWREGKCPTLDLEEYLDLVTDAFTLLPPTMVVHRLTGDPPKRLLLAPMWSANKRAVRNALATHLRERGILWGSHYLAKKNTPDAPHTQVRPF